MEEISKELTSVTPTCEITRTPRSLSDVKDWKASEKRAFLLYYATPLLSRYLPSDHHLFLMLLTGGMFRLLKQSISQEELHEAHTYLRLFTAQAPFFFGKQFQTFNVHQLLHLPEVVKDLGPLWSNSCFPFEDYNGDFHYFAIVEILDQAEDQLPKFRDRIVINHITRVKKSGRLLAVPVLNILQKYLRVDVSSGSYICQLPNPYEKD